MLSLLKETVSYVLWTLMHNAHILFFGVFIAAAITVYLDPEKIKQALMKRTGVSIYGSVAFGAFTPFCACGTMAVIVSMMSTVLPWGPIMAFLTSSPLMSPDEFVLYSGIVSFRFALALTIASIIIGICSGYITHFIDKNTNFLKNQIKFSNTKNSSSCCDTKSSPSSCCDTKSSPSSCCDTESSPSSCCKLGDSKIEHKSLLQKLKINELLKVIYELGIKKILLYFSIFVAVGFMINKFVPVEIIIKYLGAGNKFAVPLLAVIGLPLYVSSSSAIPLIKVLIAGGASEGALLAFTMTGLGTSAGVLTGLFTVMRKNIIGLYVLFMLGFSIMLGYLYDLILLMFFN